MDIDPSCVASSLLALLLSTVSPLALFHPLDGYIASFFFPAKNV